MGALLMHRPKRLLKTHHAVSSPCTARRHCTTELSVPSELNAFSLFMHARSSTASALSLCSMHRPKRLHAAQHAVSAPCAVRKHCATELSVPSELNALSRFMHARSSAARQHVLYAPCTVPNVCTKLIVCSLLCAHYTVQKHCATELSVLSELNILPHFVHARSSTACALSALCTDPNVYTQLSMRSLLRAPSKSIARTSSTCSLN
jgi:hypothetical protein